MKYKILVIDDEEVIRNFIQRVLTREGHIVETIGDSRIAIEVITKGNYDIMITDLKMPGVTGIEIAKRVKETLPQVKIIIITGSTSFETETKAKEIGIKHYLIKPFGIKELMDVVNQLY